MLWCEPFGCSGIENLLSRSATSLPNRYFFFHDQEPVNILVYQDLFQAAKCRGRDRGGGLDPVSGKHKWFDPTIAAGHVVVSEKGDNVTALCQQFDWTSHYYFYHGWAALDWYRGYNRSFQLVSPELRNPTTAFFCANRIVGGERRHRVLFLYWLQKLSLLHNHVSIPERCPETQQDLPTIAATFAHQFPDMPQHISQIKSPRLLQGESTQIMSSCWLGNWAEVHDSLIYVATETVYFGSRLHLTEKSLKPIALGMPFVLLATANSLQYLKQYGFKTFDTLWPEHYDQETNDLARAAKVAELLKSIDDLSPQEKKQLWRHAVPIIKHNWNWFYHDGFEQVLWHELTQMLELW